jgi:hypothetical protein
MVKTTFFGENALLYVSFEIIPILVSIAAKTWNNHYSMRKGFRLEWRSDYIHEVFKTKIIL